AARHLESADVLLKVRKADTDELRTIIRCGTRERRAARGDKERNSSRPRDNSAHSKASHQPVHQPVRTVQKGMTLSEGKFVNAVCYEPLRLVLTRPAIIQARVAKRETVNQIALVVSLGIDRITHCLAP